MNLPSTQQKPDSTFFQALMAHYLHQDNILWNQIRTLIAIQAGVLAAGYALRNGTLSPIIMLFGTMLTFLLLLFILKSEQDRDVNRQIMDEHKIDPRAMLSTSPPCWRKWATGKNLIRVVVIMFIILDMMLAALYQWAPGFFHSENTCSAIQRLVPSSKSLVFSFEFRVGDSS